MDDNYWCHSLCCNTLCMGPTKQINYELSIARSLCSYDQETLKKKKNRVEVNLYISFAGILNASTSQCTIYAFALYCEIIFSWSFTGQQPDAMCLTRGQGSPNNHFRLRILRICTPHGDRVRKKMRQND